MLPCLIPEAPKEEGKEGTSRGKEEVDREMGKGVIPLNRIKERKEERENSLKTKET